MSKKIHRKKEIYVTNQTKINYFKNISLFLPCMHVREYFVQETIDQVQKEVLQYEYAWHQ
jgi:hypothetical protein